MCIFIIKKHVLFSVPNPDWQNKWLFRNLMHLKWNKPLSTIWVLLENDITFQLPFSIGNFNSTLQIKFFPSIFICICVSRPEQITSIIIDNVLISVNKRKTRYNTSNHKRWITYLTLQYMHYLIDMIKYIQSHVSCSSFKNFKNWWYNCQQEELQCCCMLSPIIVLICNSFTNILIIVDDGSRKEQLFQSKK